MRRYAAAYGLWLLGVLTAALVAYYYYRSYVLPLGQQELDRLSSPHRPPPPPDPEEAAGGPPEGTAEWEA